MLSFDSSVLPFTARCVHVGMRLILPPAGVTPPLGPQVVVTAAKRAAVKGATDTEAAAECADLLVRSCYTKTGTA